MKARILRVLLVAIALVTLATPSMAQYAGASGTAYSGSYSNLNNVQRADVVRAQRAQAAQNAHYQPPATQRQVIQVAQRPAASPDGVLPPYENVSPWVVATATTATTAPTSKAPKMAEEAGEAGKIADATEASLTQKLLGFKERLLGEISKMEAAPNLDISQDSRRVELLQKMLEQSVKMFIIVEDEEQKLKADYEKFLAAAVHAGPKFRASEQHFRELASAEPVESARKLLSQTATFYAARATRIELRMKNKIPPTFEAEMTKVHANTKACREILKFLKEDPSTFASGSTSKDALIDFNSAFRSIGECLDAWTKQLIKDLEVPEAPQANPAPVAPAAMAMAF